MTELSVEQIAQVCHSANRSYCLTLGDTTQQEWDKAPSWQRESAIKGVLFIIENPDAPASASHDSWLKEKEDTGWKYGEVKDETKKEHPCFVPYALLPVDQQRKDYLFGAVVRSLLHD